jgi:hypothetical protein
MKYAFLFLIYDKFANNQIIKKLIDGHNTYIHPKYPDNVDQEFKQYIIKHIISTDWCNYSLVDATLNLLKVAIANDKNEWFFLLSGDTYPLYVGDEFIKQFNNIHHNLSIFNFKNTNDKLYKTSQWWVLNRTDVEIIISNISKYEKQFKNKLIDGCADEYYFLSVLKWSIPNYEFTNMPIMYDSWLNHTIQKSPQYFNYLLNEDWIQINKNKSLFVRKILPTFHIKTFIPKRKLYIIYIGSETVQDIPVNDEFDIILLIAIDISKINKELISRSIYIYNIIWKFFYESILNICIQPYIKNWELVIFTSENFNLSNYNSIDKYKQLLPYSKFNFKYKPLPNIKQFYYIKDPMLNLAFCIKP